jgi:hypothetical protein
VDLSGNVYVADKNNQAVKEMPAGCASSACVTTLGGGFFNPQGVAVDTDYVYTATSPAALTSPAPNTLLPGPKVTFNWSAATGGVTSYSFRLGTAAGAANLYSSGATTATSATVGGLPTNGSIIYARLYTNYGSNQVYADYVYTAPTKAALTLPTPNSTLTGPRITFSWTAGTAAAGYIFRLGTTAGGNDLHASGTLTAT